MKTLYDDKSQTWIAETWAHNRLVIAEGATMLEAMNACAEMAAKRIARNRMAAVIWAEASSTGQMARFTGAATGYSQSPA